MGQDRKFRWDDYQQAFVNRVSGEPIPDDEPVIIFRARDIKALPALRYYQTLVLDEHHKRAVQDRIDDFQAFSDGAADRLKEPGITRHIRLNSDPE